MVLTTIRTILLILTTQFIVHSPDQDLQMVKLEQLLSADKDSDLMLILFADLMELNQNHSP